MKEETMLCASLNFRLIEEPFSFRLCIDTSRLTRPLLGQLFQEIEILDYKNRLRAVSLFSSVSHVRERTSSERRAAKPRDARNKGSSPRRKKRDCPHSQSQ